LFVLISGVFYNGFNTSGFFTKEGMEAGIRMGMRAITIVIAFSAVSTELRNPLIKALLFKRGFWQLYTALGLAFSVLPHLMEKSPRPKDLIKNPLKSVIKSLADSRFLYEMFKKYRNRTKIYAITGQIHEGKTNFTEQLIIRLKKNNIKTKGFLAKGRFENNQRSEFFIQDIESGHSEKLCSLKGSVGNLKTERFVFHNLGLEFGTKLLNSDIISPDEIVVIDEIGPYELKGKGWSEPIEKLINKSNFKMIWVVRKSLIYDIFRRFGIMDGYIFDISKDTVEEAAQIIEKELV
jgi:nucleoside-triphosphatase THEP1